jgi:tungstate transport system substrate-binding protein
MNSTMTAAFLLVLTAMGCSRSSTPESNLTLATTTSTRDSGLLDALLPAFQSRTGIRVKVVAVGSGQALELGRRGDADLLLTHAPAAEDRFIEEGFGVRREVVMQNDFVLVGPPGDPADVRESSSIADGLARIARQQVAFFSRGDESGTHQKEREIWRLAGIAPDGAWYLAAGAGMAEVLRMANERNAYTLSDRATFVAQRDKLDLTILLENDPVLVNPYSVILLNPARHPHVDHEAARKLADFFLSPEAQATIADHGRKQFGQPLFHPRVFEEGEDQQHVLPSEVQRVPAGSHGGLVP